jgi:hypothetical protein
VRSDDHIGHLTAAGDQDADLAVDLPGELRELAGQVVGDDPLRRDAPPVELPDPLDLRRREAGQVAVYLLDGRSSSFESFELPLKFCKSSFQRKPEPSPFKTFWTPAFAGVTTKVDFQSSQFT